MLFEADYAKNYASIMYQCLAKSANFRKIANCFELCNVFGKGKCELRAIYEGRNWGAIFGKEKCKLLRQFQRYWGDVTSVSLSLSLSLSLCFSLSLSLSLSHRAHLTHNIGSVSALPIIAPSQVFSCTLDSTISAFFFFSAGIIKFW